MTFDFSSLNIDAGDFDHPAKWNQLLLDLAGALNNYVGMIDASALAQAVLDAEADKVQTGLDRIQTSIDAALFDTKLDKAGGTLTGDVTITNASTPTITLVDTTNTLGIEVVAGNNNGVVRTNSNHPLQLQSNNITAVTLDTSQNAIFAGNVTLSAGIITATKADSNSFNSMTQTHASYTGIDLSFNVHRAASSAYNFLNAWSGNNSDKEFNLSGDGNGTCDGSWTGGGADYAEYFEWLDGNPNNENRKGMSVVLDKGKIRQAIMGETLLGVISANPSVVGDGDIGRWKEKYLRDSYGKYLREEYTVTEWTEIVPAVTEEYQRSIERIITEKKIVEAVNKSELDNVGKATGKTVEVSPEREEQVPIVNLVEKDVPESISADGVLTPESKAMVQEDLKETILLTYKDGSAAKAIRELEPEREIKHSYETDKIPADLIVPADAVVIVEDETGVKLDRRILNPKHDPTRKYKPREERKEWATVGLMGKLRINAGQPTALNWIKMRDIKDGVEEWFIK